MAARYPISFAIVSAALLGVAALFVFARPVYRSPNQGGTISFARYHAPDHGWTWNGGQPGFRVGAGDADWNISGVVPTDLAVARAAAPGAGVDPTSIRLLHAMRLSGRDLFLLVSGSNAGSRTCLGTVLPPAKVSFACPAAKGAHRLGPQLAVVVVAALPRGQSRFGNGHGFTRHSEFPLFLMGAVRADVTKVVV